MIAHINRCVLTLLVLLLAAAPARAYDGAAAKKLLDQVKPSLVAVKYTWKSELGSQDLTAAGVVVSDDGLVIVSLAAAPTAFIPDGQMKDFKIIVPSDTGDETEIDATLEGRDERSSLMFVQASTGKNWKPVKFEDIPVAEGDVVYSVGMLPKSAGYKAYVTEAMVSAHLRGPVPQIMVVGGLASGSAVVLNAAGQAIGNVHARSTEQAMLDRGEGDDLAAVATPQVTFVPTSYFLTSLTSPPTVDHPVALSWLGCPQLKGIEKDVADFFGLKGKPSVQIGDVVADSPAAKAGLQTSDIIVSIDGKPLQRGDLPEELPAILMKQIQRSRPGTVVNLGIIRHKGDTVKEVPVTLEEQPKPPSAAKRFYASDLGFVARDTVFLDVYRRKMKDMTGVVIALLRPQAAAQAAKLQGGDLVLQLNGKPVSSLDQFKSDYQAFRKDHAKDAVVLLVSKLDGKEQTVNIEPPQGSAQPGGEN